MRKYVAICALLFASAFTGCESFSRFGASSQPVAPPPSVVVLPDGPALQGATVPLGAVQPGAPAVVSPAIIPQSAVLVPAMNRDFAWDQVVDVVDDYFKIEHEERLKLVGGVVSEGRIDTLPVTGATLFEPWRKDSANLYERWESTLQSIRRRADIRVTPVDQGYLVDVAVWKQLEAVDRPIHASAGAATFRYDTSLNRDTEFDADPNRIPGDPARPIGPRAGNSGWIDLGRDMALEQEMLAKIASRLGGVAAPGIGGATIIGPAPATQQFIAPGVIAPHELPPP
jgi:hypothetical protein